MEVLTEGRSSCQSDKPQLTHSDATRQASSATNYTLDVRWALTHDRITTMQAPMDLQVSFLKRQVAKITQTPVEYLVLLLRDSVLEARCLADADLLRSAVSTILVVRRAPEDNALLEFLKSKVKIGLMNNFFSWPAESQEDIELVRFMLACNIGVNDKDARWRWKDNDPPFCNCTALHYASLCGLSDICRLLLDSPNFREVNATAEVAFYGKTFRGITMKSTQVGCTALHCAVAGAHFDICSLLLAHPRFTQGRVATANRTPLHLSGPFKGFEGSNKMVDVSAHA